ncbi:MAG: dTMP kinase [Phycisphaerae bacterium]|nr:dTMP kinase [Phycisphaerae bacterium]
MAAMSDLSDRLRKRFIVIDGPDGAGKTTQAKLLAGFLQQEGVSVCVVCDPGGTPIGDGIRRMLLDRDHGEMSVECELMLYMASRAQLAAEVIRPALDSGQCVLCDRYISSTIAYQGAGGADVAAIRAVGLAAVGDTWPDLTVILDIDPQEGLIRAGRAADADRIESKNLEYHRKVRELFLSQARDEPGRCAVVDASGGIDQVQQRLRDAISSWQWQP